MADQQEIVMFIRTLEY